MSGNWIDEAMVAESRREAQEIIERFARIERRLDEQILELEEIQTLSREFLANLLKRYGENVKRAQWYQRIAMLVGEVGD